MSVVLLGSTSGSITLQEPAVAGTNTVNFGANTGVAILDANTPALRNRLINGAMAISQRNAGNTVTPIDGQYTLDRYLSGMTQSAKYSVQQVTDSPTGFNFSLNVTSLSAYSVGAGDAFLVSQLIEGFNTADLLFGTASAATVTLSFWVKSTLTGSFGGSLENSAQNRSYPFGYTINSASTWEYKTVTISGDTTGTWVGATNGVGLRVRFGLGSGTNFTATANAWTGSDRVQPTGTVSVVGTNLATWQVTGVQLEKGSTATSFDYRPYGQELALAQRYCEIVKMTGMTGTAGDTSRVALAQSYKVSKRASATITITSATAANYNVFRPGVEASITSPTISSSLGDSETFLIELGTFSGLTNNNSWTGRYSSGTFLASAEL
jgi:hypothetical protein